MTVIVVGIVVLLAASTYPAVAQQRMQPGRPEVTPHGYEPTREAAMAAFAKSWRRE